MKIHISDISALLPPEMPEIREDRELSEKIKADVFQKIGIEQKKSKVRKPLRIVLIAAAVTALLSATAYATVLYGMNNREVDENEVVSGIWGDSPETQKTLEYPDAGMTFSYTGPEEKQNDPEMQIGWLPSKPDFGDEWECTETEDGFTSESWVNHVSDNGEDENLPYIVSVGQVRTGVTYVLSGEPTIIKEVKQGDWNVIEVSIDYSDSKTMIGIPKANYIFACDEVRGYTLEVKGTLDMEVLERIAQSIKIRESDTPAMEDPLGNTIGLIDIGRG